MAEDRPLIPRRLAVRIGRLIALWSEIELLIEGIVWELAYLDRETGRLFTGPLQGRAKIGLVNGLLHATDDLPTLGPMWAAILPDIQTLQEARNKAAHHVWLSRPTGAIYTVTTRGQFAKAPKSPFKGVELDWVRSEPISLEDLDKWIDLARSVWRRTEDFWDVLVRALRDKPDEPSLDH